MFDRIYERDGFGKILLLLRNGLLIDTKPLILFLVSIYDSRNGTDFLRSFGFDSRDSFYLHSFIEFFKVGKLYTTPQVMTETFYFIKKAMKDSYNRFVWETMNVMLDMQEEYAGKNILLKEDCFIKFDFADVSLIATLKKLRELAIITDDSGLSEFCNSMKDRERLVIDFTKDLKPYFFTAGNL